MPTRVTVASFTARRSSRVVVLRWRTGTEIDVAGFNVYCGELGNRSRRNRALIRAKTSSGSRGRSYTFRDRIPRGVRSGPYWLQVAHVRGRPTWFGPVAPR